MLIALMFGFHINQVKKSPFDHISTCYSLIKHNENVLFLKQMVTGNEKLILYINVEWKRLWGK